MRINRTPLLHGLLLIVAMFFFYKYNVLFSGDPLNSYPFITPDGFDWYTEGVYLNKLIDGSANGVLPVLRPVIFVIVTCADYYFGNSGLVVSLAFAASIYVAMYCFVNLGLRVCKTVCFNWAVLFFTIILLIAPINFVRSYLLSDQVAQAIGFLSILIYSKYLEKSDFRLLILSSILALVGSLTQTYVLIPFLIVNIVTIAFRRTLLSSLWSTLAMLGVASSYLFFTTLWRSSISHGFTPHNFELMRFDLDMIPFYINVYIYYLAPVLLCGLILCRIKLNLKSVDIMAASYILISCTFVLLSLLYHWEESRFTFIWYPFFLLSLLSVMQPRHAKLPLRFCAALAITIVYIITVPGDYWQPRIDKIRFNLSKSYPYYFFKSDPTDRMLSSCYPDECVKLPALLNSDQYVKSVLGVYINLISLPNPKIIERYKGLYVQRPWINGSIFDGAYYISSGGKSWAPKLPESAAVILITNKEFLSIPFVTK